MYAFRSTLGPVDLAFTDRYGGVSAAPYDELNLSISGDDDEAAKAENHRLLMADFAPGAVYADLYQVHGDAVADAAPGDRPEADGIVTSAPDVVLLVRAADCLPVLLADPDAGVVGAAHAGRRGMAAGIALATVRRMRALGAERITAWLGPAICGRCYEVPEQMQAEVTAIEPASRSTTSRGTPGLDITAGVRAQLERAGVSVVDAGRCTYESSDLFSYRRAGACSGRLAAVIRVRSAS